MHNSFRWYSLKKSGKPLDVRGFYKCLLKASTEDAWFSRAESNDAIRFHRRVQLLVPELDQHGAEGSRLVEAVSSVEFSLREIGGNALLRILNPGRNMQALMSSIELAVGRGFSARSLSFEETRPISILNKADVKRIVGMKLINVAVTNDCIGRIEFASKGGIEISKLPLLRGLKYKVDYVKYEIVVNGERGAFSYASSGLVKVGGVISDLIAHEIQRDLARLA